MPDALVRRDLVVGCITDYRYEDIWPWVVSLDACGFRGDKVMIVYNGHFDLVEDLVARGFCVVTFDCDLPGRRFTFEDSVGEEILVSRFFHLWCLLDERGDRNRYVISADVKDLIFQTNPSAWLETHLDGKQLNVGSESVRFQDEPWGDGIIAGGFDDALYRHMRPLTIYNAGSMAGTIAVMRDFALQIYLIANGRRESPDQAAANLLLSLEPYRSITRFNASEDGWACQAGTSVAVSYVTGERLPLLEPSPVLDGDVVKTHGGVPFCLVHQYDRIPAWRDSLLEKYRRVSEHSNHLGRGEVLSRPRWRLKRTSR